MSKCKIVWQDAHHVKLSGVIDESATFEDLVARFGPEVWLDFSAVTRINSCGVRQWTRVIHGCSTRLHYINAPSLIVDQFSMVPEFLGANSDVESFEGRYVCESCGHEESRILVVGRDVQAGLPEYEEGPSQACPKCKATMEFDHNPEVYLDFLRNLKVKRAG